MKLLYLGLMISAITLVLLFISMNVTEGFDFDGRKVNQRMFLKDTDNYWDSRLFPQVIKGVDKESKFVELSKDKTELKTISPTMSKDKTELAKNIEKCKIVNKTGKCEEIDMNNCGYCWDTDKIIYGDKNGPLTDVCSKKNWIPPGPKTSYYCKKKKEQEICKQMIDCGDVAGEKNICAWCPLTGKGVVKKDGAGGWVAKYDEDACDWKSQLVKDGEQINFMGWTPNKGGEKQTKGEGDCDSDADCAPGLKCGHDGYNRDGVPGLRDGKNGVTPSARGKDYCYDPNDKVTFKGNLINPGDCAKFAQMFPCVGPNMTTGPHTDECLQNLWEKSGCSGTVKSRVSDQVDYNNWNTHSYVIVQDNMRSIKKFADTEKDYSKAAPAYKKCYNQDIDPCENRFKPRPPECAQRLYDNVGCSADGKLNPKYTEEWPNAYIPEWWKKGQQGDWNANTYQGQLYSYKQQMISNERNPKKDFDRTIYTNMLCKGEMPNIPWDKPCWRDFNIIMNTLPGIEFKPDSISFANAPNNFKSLLVRKTRGWWKNDYAWTGNYEITKDTYDKQYFPFWNFIKTSKEYWNNNWRTFKTKLLKTPSVKPGSPPANSKWFNWDNPSWLKRNKGHGDCDSDRDCGPGLKCAQNPKRLSGVIDNGDFDGSRDFCYDPKDAILNGSSDSLTLLNGSPFDDILPSTTSISTAIEKGHLFKTGNNKYITKEIFLHENFPYWLFLRVASVN